jgi:hypothetical protein
MSSEGDRLSRLSCGGVTRAADSGPVLSCPIRGGGDRCSCAAAAVQPVRQGPSEGAAGERRDNGEDSVGWQGARLLGPTFVLEDSLGESLASATPVGAAFPVGGVVFPSNSVIQG